MKSFAVLLPSLVLVAGCAVPLPLTIASTVADGFSYMTTEKSLTDHGISALARQDCAMHRMLAGDAICHIGADDLETAETTSNPDVRPQASATLTPIPVAETAPATPAPGPGVYMVIASSRDFDTARAFTETYRDMKPRMLAMPAGGRRVVYRIVVGPVADTDYGHLRRKASQRGIGNTWALRLGEAERPTARATPERQPHGDL